jgi:hypothetical protein
MTPFSPEALTLQGAGVLVLAKCVGMGFGVGFGLSPYTD